MVGRPEGRDNERGVIISLRFWEFTTGTTPELL